MRYHAIEVEKQIPLGYQKVLTAVEKDLGALSRLSQQKELTSREKNEIPTLLHNIGKTTMQVVKTEIESKFKVISVDPEHFEGEVKKFEDHFGHPPTIDDETGKVDVDCSTNAIMQSLLLSRIGHDKTGVFNMPEHIVPAVKIAGKTYVLERHLFNTKTAPTVYQYLKELAQARSNRSHPLHVVAKDLTPQKKASMGDILGKVSYYGGAETSLAVAHYNIGVSYHELGFPEKAESHYRKAVEINPLTGDAHYNLAEILENKGDLEGARLHYNKSLELQPHDKESRDSLQRVLKKLSS